MFFSLDTQLGMCNSTNVVLCLTVSCFKSFLFCSVLQRPVFSWRIRQFSVFFNMCSIERIRPLDFWFGIWLQQCYHSINQEEKALNKIPTGISSFWISLSITHFHYVELSLSQVPLVASGKAYSALERDQGQYMARPMLGETKLKLDLPLLKHKPKEKQVEISHNTIYNCFLSLTTLPCWEEVFLYFFKYITVRAWCSCSRGTAIVLALLRCWVVMFSLPHGRVVLLACPLCGVSSKVSWRLPTSKLPPELHSKAQLPTPLWLLCVSPTGHNIMQSSLKGQVWLECSFWWALQVILH